jgi:acyl-coenzyme A thioesterase 1/2/4
MPPSFIVHSLTGHFVLAGNSESPISYHVKRVRDGKPFITRYLQAMQNEKCIFTATVSFMRRGGGKTPLYHEAEKRMKLDFPESVGQTPWFVTALKTFEIKKMDIGDSK